MSSATSIDKAPVRSFGLWNWRQSRSSQNARIAARVGVSSICLAGLRQSKLEAVPPEATQFGAPVARRATQPIQIQFPDNCPAISVCPLYPSLRAFAMA
ncbi:MAG: hypothetical protein BWY82_02913 [Verrucomicrobia bacterium ADurb.Bin474]|nr:MAG: hypothetical protein BWY82_02913 [Verrucomicrobia bacterium ADurb.Bin474]